MLKITIDLKKIWTFSLVLYIICSTAFSYGELSMLNTYALYFFFGVSLINIFAKQRLRLNWAVVSIIAFGILSWIGLIYTPAAQSSAMGVMYSYLTMAILVICVVQYIGTVKDIKVIMVAYMLAGLAFALHVYSQYGNEFWEIIHEATENDSNVISRLDGDLANANIIAMATMISALIAMYFLIYEKTSLIQKVLCIALAVFCFIVSMAAASKKSLIILVVCLACFWLYGVLKKHNIVKQLASFACMVIVLLVLFAVIKNVPMFSTVMVRFEDLMDLLKNEGRNSSDQARLYMITEGLNVWLDHVLVGAGAASSHYYLGGYSHSNVVELLMNSGLIGFLIFYVPYGIVLYQYLTKAGLYKTKTNLAILLFSLFTSVTIAGIAFVYYYDRYYMILFAVIFSATKVFGEVETTAAAQLNKGESV